MNQLLTAFLLAVTKKSMDNRLFAWLRYSGSVEDKKDEMTLCKGLLLMLVICSILAACVYIAA